MPKKNTYHVTKTEDGWQAKKLGGERALFVGLTKEDVMKTTIALARNLGNTSVVIHKSDGIIQEERTYPRKSDPYPPPG